VANKEEVVVAASNPQGDIMVFSDGSGREDREEQPQCCTKMGRRKGH